jgi:hypothetical protein
MRNSSWARAGGATIHRQGLDAPAFAENISPPRRGCSATSSAIVSLPRRPLANPLMMVHDSTPGPGALDPETIAAVRSALVQYVAAPSDGEPLRQALDVMAAEAHEKLILPEQLLVVLKDLWYELPSVRAMRDAAEQNRLLQRAVTICIKEYYAD